MKTLKKIWNWILEIFFPSNLKCIFCGRDIPDPKICYCDECEEKLHFESDKRCKLCDDILHGDSIVCDNCKSHRKAFDRAISVYPYIDMVKKVILKFKDSNAKYLAPHMAQLMNDRLKQTDIEFDIIIPMPLSKKSFSKRKFNQAQMLAEELSKLCNLPVETKCFEKVKETKHQKELGFFDRQKNLHHAFKVTDKTKILNKSILLVDDVMTTGATANECAKELKKFANKVFVITFARKQSSNKIKK